MGRLWHRAGPATTGAPGPYALGVTSSAGARIDGLDVARGLAVLGMFVAHVGTAGDAYPPTEIGQLADGRSAALFALLAGVSVALISGGSRPVTGDLLERSRVRVLARALLVFTLHWPLLALGTPVLVILGSYAVMFAAVVPVLRWRPATLFALAAGIAVVVAPLVLLADRALEPTLEGADATLVELVGLVLTGPYPAVVWVAYVLVGLGVGRMVLTAVRVQLGLVLCGAVLAVAGYGVALLGRWGVDVAGEPTTADLLGTAEPHADTTTELVGNTGIALLVLGLCLVATRLRALRLLLYPVGSTGALVLTAYAGHIVAIALLGNDVVWASTTQGLVAFVVVTLVVTSVWRALLGRGPLEALLHGVSTWAADAMVPVQAGPDPEPAVGGRHGGRSGDSGPDGDPGGDADGGADATSNAPSAPGGGGDGSPS